MRLKYWVIFTFLGLIWGSSFLWIKIAVGEAGPFTVIALRLLFGLLGMLAVVAVTRQRLPRDQTRWLKYLFLGLFNTAIPMTLIAWGETRIASGLASILNATVPLFTIVIAHFWLADEKITAPRLAGLAVGFAGVVVLGSRGLGEAARTANVWGQVAVLVAAGSYGLGITFVRRHLRGEPPVLQAMMTVLIADAYLWAATPLVERPLVLPHSALAWFAIAWLGLLGSCSAYLLYYSLIRAWGPTRASLVSYVFPVIGLILGIVFLHEQADWRLLVGAVLIVGGIGVVNLRLRPRAAVAPAPGAAEAARIATSR